MKIERPRNPRYTSEHNQAIDIDVYIEGLGEITISCHEGDKEAHVIALLVRIRSGEFGPVAAFKGSPMNDYFRVVGERSRVKKIMAEQMEKSMAALPLDYSRDDLVALINYRNSLLEWKPGLPIPDLKDFE